LINFIFINYVFQGRISLQIDCGFPLLLGECSVSDPYEIPVVEPGHWYKMVLSHKPSIGETTGNIYKISEYSEPSIASLTISESYGEVLYKYGICGDSNDDGISAVFTNVTAMPLKQNLLSNSAGAHLTNEKLYNLTMPVNDYKSLYLYDSGIITYELADPNSIEVNSLNIVGKNVINLVDIII